MLQRTSQVLVLAGMLLFCGNNDAAAQSGANVLVVINDASQASRTIGEYYIRKRIIPPANVCHLTTKTDETISRGDYDREIQQPIWHCIASTSGQDRLLYIVLTKGIPLRIDGTTGGREGTIASVDSELAILYRRGTGIIVPLAGPVPNPYFAGNWAVTSTPRPFTHERGDIFLVTRLDGFTVEDVIGLIDRASAAGKEGRILLDERSSWQATGNTWLRAAADTLKSIGLGDRVELDESSNVLKNIDGVLGYYSWGSNDTAIRTRHFNLGFAPGALAAMFVSSDARTFKEPPANWTLGDWDKQDTYFAGSPQSLAGDLIRDGVTGTAGHVAEPYLDATIRPDILFPAYVTGSNLAESFYQAMPYLSWQTVVIGDPLCAPFRARALEAEEVEKAVDSATELPAIFSARRLKVVEAGRLKREAATAFLRYESRSMRGNAAGARQALEEATVAEPRFTAAHVLLGTAYQKDGEMDSAAAHYGAVLAYAPSDVLALNNLAYLLAVHRHAPQDALPLAERAAAIAKNDPMVLDTLGWIQHLLGKDEVASRSLRDAVAGAPNSAELRWHAAVVYAGIQDLVRAAAELDTAVKLDPQVADPGEIHKLSERLAAKDPSR